MLVLVCNVGSTSLKYKLYEMPSEAVLCESRIERVGSRGKGIFHYKNLITGTAVFKEGVDVPGYREGIELFISSMTSAECGVVASIDEVAAVGFKTVLSKGYYQVHELNDAVLEGMREYLCVAPAHNAHYLEAIETFKELLPHKTLIGVFETAFHTTMPAEAYIYSTPYEWFEKYEIRRMGYHGASHRYIAETIGSMSATHRLISCHLGGSGSLCAIKDGRSVDTSFGLSLQTGIPHANRVGDIDPYILVYLMKKEGLTLDEVLAELNTQSGLLGISGISNDMREVEQAALAGNERAELVLKIYCRDIVKYIGAYTALLGGLDYLVFTGGIGENSKLVRKRILGAIAHMGIEIDEEKNEQLQGFGEITTEDSRVKAFVIPANEELGIARSVYRELAQS